MGEAIENYLQIKSEEIEKQVQRLRMNTGAIVIALVFSFIWYGILMYLSYIDKISMLEHLLGMAVVFLFTIFVITQCRVKFFERIIKVQGDILEFIHIAIEYPDSAVKVIIKEKIKKSGGK